VPTTPRPIWCIGGAVIRNIRGNILHSSSARASGLSTRARGSRAASPSRHLTSPTTPTNEPLQHLRPGARPRIDSGDHARPTDGPLVIQRAIWFPDENPPGPSVQASRENAKLKKRDKEEAEKQAESRVNIGSVSSPPAG
jgi:hypothetical protein